MKKLLTTAAFLFSLFNLTAQINGFAKVGSISGTTLTLSNVVETYDMFAAGELVIIMQMQGADIGSNNTNTASFGTLATIGSAGLYEVRKIASVTRNSGALVSIQLTAALTNTYDATKSLQVITFPTFGSNNSGYTTTANITTVAWNGNTGGVTAMNVSGTLRLANNISANGAGFRGGLKASGGNASCDNSSYIHTASSEHGNKGTGIYMTSNPNFTSSKAKIINGGGGGNLHNAGGGGGANYSAGGNGGIGYNANGCVGGGFGGQNLGGYIGAGRIFMGGGGGGGQENDGTGSNGANGGGIILIKADSIVVKSPCSSTSITANGSNSANAGNDGAGGAGGAGTIVLDINGMRIQSSCPLTISANGGNGGNSTDASVHGGGGGGGQGAIILGIAPPYVNATVTTLPGTGGTNNLSGSSSANAGAGPNNSGIIYSNTSPLPVTWLSFNATELGNQVSLEWKTASESNNSHFNVLHSADGTHWNLIDTKTGSGSSNTLLDYHSNDANPVKGLNYYRIEQVDFNGVQQLSEIATVYFRAEGATLSCYPNPVTDMLSVEAPAIIDPQSIQLAELTGQTVEAAYILTAENRLRLDMSHLSAGYYQLSFNSGGIPYTTKIVLKHP